MNTVLNYLAISALTTAAATAVAMGEPAMLELAIARVGLMIGTQKDATESIAVGPSVGNGSHSGLSSRTPDLLPVSKH